MTPVHWMASPVIVVRKLECSFQEKKYVYIVQKMNIKILGIGQIGGGGIPLFLNLVSFVCSIELLMEMMGCYLNHTIYM